MSLRPQHALLLLLLGSALGCFLVTKADDSADRCETAEDCPQPDDKRYQTVCEFGEKGLEEDLDPADVDMVCVGAFAPLSCDPNGFIEGHPVAQLIDSRRPPDYASPCDGEKAGTKGCPGTCVDGLTKNADDICDDDDPNTPPAIRSDPDENLHQDILDQFCRSFFCDRTFVCDTDGHICKPCDPSMPYGNSGCGDLYINGELSCLYLTAAELGASCQAPDPNRDEPNFGDCPEA
jgi:hypothetical protein